MAEIDPLPSAEDIKRLIEVEIPGVLQVVPCGSRVTCRPAPTDTDRDWLVLVGEGRWEDFAKAPDNSGWTIGGSDIPNDENHLPPDARFNSFTIGEDNIIATCSLQFFERFYAATTVAKRLNLLDKADRIALFQAVLYAKADE